MRDTYHDELDAISSSLVEMANLVGSAMSRATTALLDGDLQLAEQVITADEAVDARYREVEARGRASRRAPAGRGGRPSRSDERTPLSFASNAPGAAVSVPINRNSMPSWSSGAPLSPSKRWPSPSNAAPGASGFLTCPEA